jgi:hypothetical protein
MPAIRCAPGVEEGADSDSFRGTAAIHDTPRLADSYRGLRNAHYGSHQFLIDDLVKACVLGKTPPNHVWEAARFNAPGFGSPPSDQLLDTG